MDRRGVAQPGSALAWGARGREFESRRPDQIIDQWSDHILSPSIVLFIFLVS